MIVGKTADMIGINMGFRILSMIDLMIAELINLMIAVMLTSMILSRVFGMIIVKIGCWITFNIGCRSSIGCLIFVRYRSRIYIRITSRIGRTASRNAGKNFFKMVKSNTVWIEVIIIIPCRNANRISPIITCIVAGMICNRIISIYVLFVGSGVFFYCQASLYFI